MDDNSISVFAETNWRNQHKRFGIRQEDRRHHMYVIGKTGTGKSTLLATLIKQDLERSSRTCARVRPGLAPG
jgi:type IV secretory pathway VirB4 component